MKLPRIVGVSVVFQRQLLKYSPSVCRKLMADSALRRVFYDLVRQQPTAADAFNQRYSMFKGARAVVERQNRYSSRRAQPGADKTRENAADRLKKLNDEIAKLPKGLMVKQAAAKLAKPTTDYKEKYLLKTLRLKMLP